MRAKLVCKFGKFTGTEVPIANELTIGKESENELVIKDNYISRRHARIYYDAAQDSYILEDFKSRNGTRLDGETVRKKERLSTINVITFGNRVDFFFVRLVNEQAAADQPPDSDRADSAGGS